MMLKFPFSNRKTILLAVKWEECGSSNILIQIFIQSIFIQENYSLVEAVDINTKVTAECDNS